MGQRNSRGRVKSRLKKKVKTPSMPRGKVRAKSSVSKVISTNIINTQEVNRVFRGKKLDSSVLPNLRETISLLNEKLYISIHRRWQSFAKILSKLHIRERRIAIIFREYLITIIGSTLLLLFFTLVGLNSPANYPPLFTIIYLHKDISILLIILFAIYFLRILLVETEVKKRDTKKVIQNKKHHALPLFIINVISYTSSIILLFILLLLLIRPIWCPTTICPTSQRILVFHPQSIHDANLEMYFIANQSTFYTIPGNPVQYPQSNLPKSIPALHTDGESSLPLYHLIIGLNNLQQGHFGMIIEEVDLVILQVYPLPHPLNVWNNTSYVHDENENQYRVLYLGQQAGAVIPADYLRFQFGFVQLKPGETDQIDIHVISRIEANILFTVQFDYRIGNESQIHTLRLPQQFEVLFANKSDWHLHHL